MGNSEYRWAEAERAGEEKSTKNKNKLRGFSPQSELYRPSDRRLSKLVPTLADRGCGVVRAMNPHGR
jgi:hypothetical protein